MGPFLTSLFFFFLFFLFTFEIVINMIKGCPYHFLGSLFNPFLLLRVLLWWEREGVSMQNFHVGLVGHYGRFIQKKVGWDMSMDQRTNISQEKKPLKASPAITLSLISSPNIRRSHFLTTDRYNTLYSFHILFKYYFFLLF